MKLRMYALAKEIPHPLYDNQKTLIFFSGWDWDKKKTASVPVWGQPHMDGIRSRVSLYPDAETRSTRC